MEEAGVRSSRSDLGLGCVAPTIIAGTSRLRTFWRLTSTSGWSAYSLAACLNRSYTLRFALERLRLFMSRLGSGGVILLLASSFEFSFMSRNFSF